MSILPDIKKVKDILYKTLTLNSEESQSSEVIKQNMDVALTPAMKRNGVNIIQIQSVVSNKITVNIINALKELDNIEENIIEAEVTNGEEREIQQIIDEIKNTSLPLPEFMKKVKNVYIKYAIENYGSKTAAAKRLQIQRTYLSRITSSTQEN